MNRNKQEKLTRIAIVIEDKCKPNKCKQECKKKCPVVKLGKECIEVTPKSKNAYISEELCIGCGMCVKACPFKAIQIINIPKDLSSETTHRYGVNSFKLHRLPIPHLGQVLGLVGSNGTGKSTALKILSGKLKPNLGLVGGKLLWDEIIKYFRGSELQNYFTKMCNSELKISVKPQYVDSIPMNVNGKVKDILKNYSKFVWENLSIDCLMDKNIHELSGGELQRFAIAALCAKNVDVYMFDEPSSYLDIKQRMIAARVIRSLVKPTNYVIIVEHDLSILDYLSDYICILYGVPGAYGVVTLPFSVAEGINVFLSGMIPTENLRFREVELNFKSIQTEMKEKKYTHSYGAMTKVMGNFKLEVKPGNYNSSEIIVLLGENGTGKTTFIRMLAGIESGNTQKLNVSYKPQKILPKFDGTVEQLLNNKISSFYNNPQFITDVVKPLAIYDLKDQMVDTLSGGELQRVAVCLTLGKPADIYLIDEPSAYLDSEYRIIVSKVIKRFIIHSGKTGFIVEHDFIMATYLADRVIVYEGSPSIDCIANSPESLLTGMNKFLSILNVTFRKDPYNFRPRINKLDSTKDYDQKKSGTYFYIDNNDD